jgi:diguanylate cyclase (GGDEF)-like protein
MEEQGASPAKRNSSAGNLQELWETRAGQVLGRVGLNSVRTTILTLAVAATLIPAMATSWISYRQNRRAIEEKLEDQLQGSSTQASRELGLWIRERLNDMSVFAASYEVTENLERSGISARRLPEYLSSVNERYPTFQVLMVIAPDRRTVASSAGPEARLNFTGDWMRQARLGDRVLGDPVPGDSIGATTMEMAIPIANAGGRFLGVFGSRLVFEGIVAPLEALRSGTEGRLVTLRRDGSAILSIGAEIERVPEAVLSRLEAADGASVAYDAADGVAVIGALAPVPGTDWMMLAELPASTAYADIRQLRNATVLLMLVLLLVVGTLAYALGLLIVLPLERLARAAKQVEDGQLDVEVPATGRGEISQLTFTFNEMVRGLREGRAKLERLSVTDDLTGLANRRFLTAELEREVQRSERLGHTFAVLMLDVDHFKVFNDTHGHPAGDAVLQGLAILLRKGARAVDTVARYGGEEFLLILPETPATEASKVAARICKTVAAHRFVVDAERTEVSVTVSVGYAMFPANAKSLDELVEAADQALYKSKAAGRNRVTAAG